MKDHASVFNPRLVAGIVAAGIAAFAAFLLLFAYADDFRSGHDGRGHPLSVSAIGFSGLVKLIGLQGGDARLIRNPIELDREDLVVVALEERTGAKAVAELLKARDERPTLLILPKWAVAPNPLRQEWVQAAGLNLPAMNAAALKEVAAVEVHQYRLRGRGAATGREALEGLEVPLGASLQTVSGEALEPVLVAAGGRMLIARVGERPLYILAEPDLMNNRGLKDPARARATLAILDRLSTSGARAVDFDLTVNGFGRKPGVLRLAFEPPFLALTLALFVAALLAGLHGAFRFGPAARDDRAVPLGKAALVENSAGLFRLARREAAVGPAYADLIREAAAHASGAGPSLTGEALDLYLDRLSPPEAPFSALAGRAAAARNRFDLLAAARDLFSWKKDLIK
jgi:hypothetical protein